MQEAREERQKIIGLYLAAYKNFTVEGMTLNGYDSTGVNYVTKLTNKLSSMVLNSNYRWAHIEVPKYEDISQEDKLQFELITNTVFDVIQADSNFESEKTKILRDFLIGTCAFKVKYTGDIMNPVEIEHRSILDIYLPKERKGKIEDVFCVSKNVTKDSIRNMYEDIEGIEEKLKDIQDTQKIDVWEATVYDYKTKDFIYCVALDQNFEKIIFSEHTEYNPWIVSRFEKLGYSPYGAGPCIKSILELLALKANKKKISHIGDMQSDPSHIYYGDTKYLLRARIGKPGTISQFGTRNNSIEKFNRGEGADIKFFEINGYKETLRDMFYINLIENITEIDQLKNITATTTQAIITEFSRQIEPTYSLMQKELLEGIVMKTYECCKKSYKISIQDIKCLKENPKLKIRFYNSLTIAQDQDDMERSELYYQAIVNKFGPMGAIAGMNKVEYIDALRKQLRVSNKSWKDGKEMEKAFEEIQQYMAEQQGGMQ